MTGTGKGQPQLLLPADREKENPQGPCYGFETENPGQGRVAEHSPGWLQSAGHGRGPSQQSLMARASINTTAAELPTAQLIRGQRRLELSHPDGGCSSFAIPRAAKMQQGLCSLPGEEQEALPGGNLLLLTPLISECQEPQAPPRRGWLHPHPLSCSPLPGAPNIPGRAGGAATSP